MKIEWTNPTIIAAVIAGVFALGAALVQLLKKGGGSSRSASQASTFSRNTTQIQAGRDVRTTTPDPSKRES